MKILPDRRDTPIANKWKCNRKLYLIYIYLSKIRWYLQKCNIWLTINSRFDILEHLIRTRNSVWLFSLADLYIILFLILMIIAVIFMAQKELLHRRYHEPDHGQNQKVGGQETVWIKLQLLIRTSDKNCIILCLSSGIRSPSKVVLFETVVVVF